MINDFLKEDVEEVINCCNDFLNKGVLVLSNASLLFYLNIDTSLIFVRFICVFKQNALKNNG